MLEASDWNNETATDAAGSAEDADAANVTEDAVGGTIKNLTFVRPIPA
jgi:hypothetical protein